MDTRTDQTSEWKRASCPARLRPVCSVCGLAINARQRMVYIPRVEVRHERCHEEREGK